MTKKSFIICILLLCIFLLDCEAKKKGKSSTVSRASSKQRKPQGQNNNCEYVDGVKKCQKTKKSKYDYQYQLVIALIFVVGFIYFRYFSLQNPQNRKKIIKTIIGEYLAQNKGKQCLLTQQQRQQILSNLKSKLLITHAVLKDNSQVIDSDLKVIKIEQVQQFVYLLTIECKDYLGISTLQGVLVFKEKGFGVKLCKEYLNREKGKHAILMFEGEGNLDRFEGAWEYNGLKDTDKHSGRWSLMFKHKVQ